MKNDLLQYRNELKILNLPKLEARIKKFPDYCFNVEFKDRRPAMCLMRRRKIINDHFRFTPEMVDRIGRVNRILNESTEFEEDENNGLSDYEAMAEILDNEKRLPLESYTFVDYDEDASAYSVDSFLPL